jgi:hypothetical protein
MRFMNEYDIRDAHFRYLSAETMNRLRVTRTVWRLAQWADANGDGWHSWPAPCRAAAKAIALIEGGTWAEREALEETDATDAEVRAALSPIKAFLTRQGVPHSQVITDI